MYISSTMTFQGSKVWRIGTQSSILKGGKDPVIDCTQHTVSSLTSSNLSWEFEVRDEVGVGISLVFPYGGLMAGRVAGFLSSF